MKYEAEFCVECYLPSTLDAAKSLIETNAHTAGFAVKLKPSKAGELKITRDNQIVYTKEKPLSTLKIDSALEKLIDTSTNTRRCCLGVGGGAWAVNTNASTSFDSWGLIDP